MKALMEKLERLLELGGMKKDIVFLTLSGIAVICSLLKLKPFPFDPAWIAIILCGVIITNEYAPLISPITFCIASGIEPVLMRSFAMS